MDVAPGEKIQYLVQMTTKYYTENNRSTYCAYCEIYHHRMKWEELDGVTSHKTNPSTNGKVRSRTLSEDSSLTCLRSEKYPHRHTSSKKCNRQ